MKKIRLFSAIALAGVFALSFTSCQKDSSDSAKTETESHEGHDHADEAALPDPTAANSDNPVDPSLPVTTVEWEKKLHDFGDIPKGEKQKYIFTFTNTGDNPLVISSATAGCGCTVPKKPDEPIAPGETGEIEVEYNGSGNGKISKNVTVLLNTEEGKDILNISANVIE